MRKCLIVLYSAVALLLVNVYVAKAQQNPLIAYSTEWDAPEYAACNTAAKATYMSAQERELIWVLNMARLNPPLFARTVVKPYSAENGIDMESQQYYRSLMRDLMKMEPLTSLIPDRTAYNSARCHAETSGKAGYDGHKRQTSQCEQVKKFHGECCSYGVETPVGVVVTLLVDEDVPSLGHRKICLGAYGKIGVAIRPHKGYRTNAVMDFLRP